MPFQEHSVAPGFNNAGAYVNFEDYFAAPFAGDRVPDGSVSDDALSGNRRVDGWRRVYLRTGACAYSELTALVNAIFGSWAAANQTEEVTARHRVQGNTYDDFNCLLFKPQEGTHFQRGATIDDVSDVELEFLVLSEAS